MLRITLPTVQPRPLLPLPAITAPWDSRTHPPQATPLHRDRGTQWSTTQERDREGRVWWHTKSPSTASREEKWHTPHFSTTKHTPAQETPLTYTNRTLLKLFSLYDALCIKQDIIYCIMSIKFIVGVETVQSGVSLIKTKIQGIGSYRLYTHTHLLP